MNYCFDVFFYRGYLWPVLFHEKANPAPGFKPMLLLLPVFWPLKLFTW